MTLQDLLLGAQDDPRYRYGGGAGGLATPPGPSATDLDPAIEAQIRELSQPEDVTPRPVPKQSKLWQRLAAAIASAGSTYAAGMGAGRPTDFSGDLRDRDREAKDIEAMNAAMATKARREGKRVGGELRLRTLLRDQERMATSAEKRAESDEKAALRREDERRRVSDNAAKVAEADMDRQSREKIEKMGNDARARSDQLQMSLHKARALGEADKDQHKEYSETRKGIIAAKNTRLRELAEGKITPQQIRQEWQDKLDSSDLSGAYAEAANAFWEAQIGAALFRYEYENQGPQNYTRDLVPPRSATNRDVGGGL
jgi:hypothetical protein